MVSKTLLALLRVVLTCLSITCLVLPSAYGQATPQRELARLPFSVIPGYGGVVVPVFINGKGPFQFLVDTGTNSSLITEAALARLDSKEYRSKVRDADPAVNIGQKVRQVISPNEVSVGRLRFTALSLVVVRKDILSNGADTLKDIDGIIGSICLSIFAVEFDFKDKIMSFYVGGNVSRLELLSIFGTETVVNNVPIDDDFGEKARYRLTISVNSKPIPMLLDTGSSYTIIPRKSLPDSVKRGKDIKYSRDVMGVNKLDEIKPDEIRIGDVQLSDTSLWSAVELPILKQPEMGLFGLDILSRCHFVIDFPAKRMYFTTPRKPSPQNGAP